MHQVFFPATGKTHFYAASLEELSPRETIKFFELLYLQQTGKISIDDFRRMLLAELLQFKKTVKYYRMLDDEKTIIHDMIERLTQTLDSFYEWKELDGQLVQDLNLKFIKNLIPRIGKYYGPADGLVNATFYEYKEALGYFLEYSKTKDDAALCNLLAVLYRPAKTFFRIRKMFSGKEIEKRTSFSPDSSQVKLQRRSEKFSKLNPAIKYAVYTWFSNIVDNIIHGTANIDGHEISLSVLFDNKGEDTGPSGIGLTGIVYSLAESAVFGNADETYNTNLYDVLARLYQLKVEHDKISKK